MPSLVEIPSKLQRDTILENAIMAFSSALAPLRAFTTAFKPSLVNTKEIEIPYWPMQGEASKTFVAGTGYTATQKLKQYAVSFNTADVADGGDFKRLYQDFSWTSAEWERYQWNPEIYGRLKGYQLASDVIAEILALVVAASFPLNYEGAAASFTFNVLMTSLGVKAAENAWPETMRSLLLNPTYFGNFMADPAVSSAATSGTNQVFENGAVKHVAGWDIFPPVNGIPANTAGNGGGTKKLVGMGVHPSALACCVAPLTPTDPVRETLSSFEIIQSAEIPDLAFAHRAWANPQLDTAYEVIECRFAKKAIIPVDKDGTPVGTNPGLIRIIAPS